MPNRCVTILTMLMVAAAQLRAGDKESRLPLDELLATPISTAARYDQQLSSVAASVTVITAEEIERYGWTTLDEAIQSVKGLYVTNDRSNTTFGVRGIGRPNDFNTRVLILLDGHSMNGGIWGEGATSGALALDMSTVEKIEIVRGPGSALYGSHAMLAVINIITKGADSLPAVTFSVLGGSSGRRELSFSSGRELAGGTRLTASAFWSETEGRDLYYPEFDEPGISDGVARGLAYENLFSVMAGLRRGGLQVSLSTRGRMKGVPTGTFDSQFNSDSKTTERRDLAVITYNRSAGLGKTIELSGSWDRNRLRGDWVYDSLGIDRTRDDRWSGAGRFQWDVRPNQRLTVGTELKHHSRAEYRYTIDDYDVQLAQPFTESSYYVQHEYHPTPRLGFVSGVRHDRFSHAPSTTNPRAAVLFTPNRETTFKLLYGTAFLSPNVYQTEFSDPETPWKVNPSLEPEGIRTLELVFERRLSPEVMLVSSAYRINADSLIESQLDTADSVYWYQNLGSMTSTGMSVGLDWRRESGLWAHASYATQQADGAEGHLANSPRHLVKAGISTTPWKKVHGGLEAVYESSRHTRSGGETDGFLLLSGTVSHQLGPRLRASIAVRNLLDTEYAFPAGAEFRPQAIPQDGRSLSFKLTYSR
jgi:outer membrane cobalamin receptor